MNHRIQEIYGLSGALAAAQTIPIELNMIDPISQIIIDLRLLNAAGGDTIEHPIAVISKIEIVDGSDVLFSLDGLETEACDIYDSGLSPRGGWLQYMNGGPMDRQIALTFGRYLWDEVLALNPKKFLNPKLNITLDRTLGGQHPESLQISVLASLFDEKKITPTGFLMTKEHKRWTKTVNGHEYTECPTDYPYRKLFLQSRLAGIPPNWIFKNIKLSTDQDKKVILDNEFRDLLFGIGRENAFIREMITASGGALARIASCTPTMDVMGTGNYWQIVAAGAGVATYDGDGGRYRHWQAGNANCVHHVHGWAPHGTLCIPFGKQGVIEDWFTPAEGSSLRLDVQSGNETAVQKLFIQQYRKY